MAVGVGIGTIGDRTDRNDALLELERSTRDLRRKRGDIITIMSESIPITANQCYIMVECVDTQIVNISSLHLCSVQRSPPSAATKKPLNAALKLRTTS